MGLQMIKIQEKWEVTSINKKIHFFKSVVMGVVISALLFAVWTVQFFIFDINTVLEDNMQTTHFVEAIRSEHVKLKAYAIAPTIDKQTALLEQMHQTEVIIAHMPDDYKRIGEERCMKVGAIRNSYPVYKDKVMALFREDKETSEYMINLYTAYEMREYIENYGSALLNQAVAEGNRVAQEKQPLLKGIVFLTLLLGVVLIYLVDQLAMRLDKALVEPIVMLAEASRKIARNEFLTEPIYVKNKDELGELVSAFNKMNVASAEYIATLNEKQKVQEMLHEEALQRLAIQKQFERTRFQLLKSQIHPHFLFNTLNIIAGMADIEEALVTEKMIKALSYLFRYNLKTNESIVLLKNEVKLINDYMYLQQIRFGERVQFEMDCRVDVETVQVPTFVLQPLVENAVIHGLSKQQKGGKIRIQILQKQERLRIVVVDSGRGIEKTRLLAIQKGLQTEDEQDEGIGILNIWRRIQSMYGAATFSIRSKERVGTMVTIEIPCCGVDVNGEYLDGGDEHEVS